MFNGIQQDLQKKFEYVKNDQKLRSTMPLAYTQLGICTVIGGIALPIILNEVLSLSNNIYIRASIYVASSIITLGGRELVLMGHNLENNAITRSFGSSNQITKKMTKGTCCDDKCNIQ